MTLRRCFSEALRHEARSAQHLILDSPLAAVRRATAADKQALIDKVSAFIFDCDGVIWRGDSVIDGVPETLDWLRSKACSAVSPCSQVDEMPKSLWP